MSITHQCASNATDPGRRSSRFAALIPLRTGLLLSALVSDCLYWGTGRALFFQASEWLLGTWLTTGVIAAVDALVQYVSAGFVRLSRTCWLQVGGIFLTLLLSLSNLLYRLTGDGGQAAAPVGIGLTVIVLCLIYAMAGLGHGPAVDAPQENIDEDDLEPLW